MDERATSRFTLSKRAMTAIAATVTTAAMLPIAVAQQQVTAGEGSTVIAVSDSDGSTSDIDKIVSESESNGANVTMVTPDEGEETEGYSGDSTESEGEGSPDSEDGDVERDLDGDLLAESALEGVELMQPKIEEALSSVPDDEKILVVASGNGAGAAGNILEEIAFDEGPVTKDRILGHILIGDPYRTGSSGESSEARDEYEKMSFEDVSLDDDTSVGFLDDGGSVDELPEAEEESEADREIEEALEADSEDGVDRIGENNNGDVDDLYSDDSSSDDYGSEYGSIDGRKVTPQYQEEYGADPTDNPNTPETNTYAPEEDEEDSSGDSSSGSGDPSEEGGSSSDSSGSGAGQESDDAPFEDNYVEDDWKPGNGSEGQDIQENRPADPEANRGEGSVGDGEIWANENGSSSGERSTTERGVTSSDESSLVSTPGSGILGQRERGFGDLEDSTLSVCASEDERCASSGIPSLMVDVLTGDLQRTPELAEAVLRGIIALGKLIVSLDKQEVSKLATQSTKCGASIATVSASGAAGVAAVSSGVASAAAIPAITNAAVAGGGAAQSCGDSAESSLRLSADIYREYKSNPDLMQATELISLIDPESASYQKIKSKMPVQLQNPQMEAILHRLAKVGYALDNIRADEFMEQYADNASDISDLNPVGISGLLTTTLSLTDAIVKAMFDVDQTVFGRVASAIGGATGSSSMIGMFGRRTGEALTAAGAKHDSGAMSGSSGSRNSGSPDGDLQIRSRYADRYDYNEMEVGEGLSATDFAAQFAVDALT